jgi:Transposase DDE domain
MQLGPRLLDLWETEVVPQLPERLDEQARLLKAYQRYREIERASDLLRALLAWVLGGCSFRQLGCWAVLLGVADISEAAWRKRVRQCGEWLHWLLTEVMSPARPQAEPSQPRVLVVDGTSLGQTGGTGDDWRVQFAYDLVEGRLVHVQVGDRHQAETMVGLPARAGDLFVGDRGYGVRRNVIAVDEMQAASLVRFSPNHCRVEQADGSLFEVGHWLQGLPQSVRITEEEEGYCVEADTRVKVRVLALRLPPEQAHKARERVEARAKRKQQVVRPETLQLAGWVLLLSTLDARDFSAEELFWLYRSRWQIELLIKQLKQFLLLVRLRSRHPDTVRATVLAALVAWVLQEEEGQALLRSVALIPEQGQQSLLQAYLPLLEQWEAEDKTEETVGKSPQEAADELRRPVSMWLVTACCLSRWRAVVLGQWSAARVQSCLPRLRRFLCPSPRRRVHQRLCFLAWAQQRFLATPLSGTFP